MFSVSKVTSSFHRLLLDVVVDDSMEPDGPCRLSHAWKERGEER